MICASLLLSFLLYSEAQHNRLHDLLHRCLEPAHAICHLTNMCCAECVHANHNPIHTCRYNLGRDYAYHRRAHTDTHRHTRCVWGISIIICINHVCVWCARVHSREMVLTTVRPIGRYLCDYWDLWMHATGIHTRIDNTPHIYVSCTRTHTYASTHTILTHLVVYLKCHFKINTTTQVVDL